MKLPEEVRRRFQRQGRAGGLTRARSMSPEARSRAARRAATTRWIRARFGASRFADLGLPGGDIVDAGLADLAAGKVTVPSLLVSLAASRLRREGIPVGPGQPEPEERLFRLLERTEGDLAHARYNALRRRMVAFADSCRIIRGQRGRHAP